MIDTIWCFMLLISLVFALANGTVPQVSTALLTGAQKAITLCLTLAGTMAFWLGMAEIAAQTGLTKKLQKLLLPLVHRLFPEYKDAPEVEEKISLNIIANLLGLGNAATPLGLAAMDAMGKRSGAGVLSRGMVLFVVMNTASLQLIPTQMAALRTAYGSVAPFVIIPQVWLVSTMVMCTCVLLCKWFDGKAHKL